MILKFYQNRLRKPNPWDNWVQSLGRVKKVSVTFPQLTPGKDL